MNRRKFITLFSTLLLIANTVFAETDYGSIFVDLNKQELTWIRGQETETFLISSGKPESPTPISRPGKPFVIQSKQRSYLLKEVYASRKEKVFMPYWMSINESRGIAIHGVKNIWGAVYPGSGACVRMKEEDAAWLFPRVTTGKTTVIIVGSEANYLAQNAAFPWQREGEKELIEPLPEGGGYRFKKDVTSEMGKIYIKLINEKRLGFYRPSKQQIAKDPRWETNGRFINFPNIKQMGLINKMSYDAAAARYITKSELEALMAGRVEINR